MAKLYSFIIACCLVFICGCNKMVMVSDPAVDPRSVYDNMWKNMDRNYALFTMKGVNWDSIYSIYRPMVTQNYSNEDLFHIISQSLETLKDGHVTIISAHDTATYLGFYNSYPVNFNLNNVLKYYLNNQYNVKGPIIYKIQDSIGYMYYGSFRDDVSDEELDGLFSELIATKALIIDVRSNTGGSIANVQKLYSHFIRDRMLVKYERVKNGPGHQDFATPEPFYISPSKIHYDKPIILLTNRSCFSACNDFALFMSYLANVSIVGDQTGGGGAIPVDYLMINGWKLQYSASMTLSKDMEPVENGIPPEFRVNINSIDDANGSDPILEKGYELIH